MQQDKLFLEAFPTLKLNAKLNSVMPYITVKRMACSADKKFLKIYVSVSRLIEKVYFFQIEKLLNEQVLKEFPYEAQIIETYELPTEYTLSQIIEAYQDSFVLELSNNKPFFKHFLQKAVFDVDDTHKITIHFENSPLIKQKEKEWNAYFVSIFSNRFAFDTEVKLVFDLEPTLKNVTELPPVTMNKVTEDIQQAPVVNTEEKANEQPKPQPKPQTASGALNKRSKEGYGEVKKAPNMVVSDDPAVIYGRNFNDETKPISAFEHADELEICIKGEIFQVEFRELRNNERSMAIFAITDYTDSIQVKLFVATEDVPTLQGKLKIGTAVKVKGFAKYDSFDKEVTVSRSIFGIVKIDENFKSKRQDNAPKKRVELHCHSKFSQNDAMASVESLVGTAAGWGQPGIALTDHGCVYGFPVANHYIHDHKIQDFKMIYGMEGYLVDDTKETVVNPENRLLNDTYVAFDFETTGISPVNSKIIEIGAVKVENGKVVDTFSEFVNPGIPIPFRIEQLTHISDAMVKDADPVEVVLPKFLAFIGDCYLIAHNAEFDVTFLTEKLKQLGISHKPFSYIDTLGLSRVYIHHIRKYTLDSVAKELKIVLQDHHRATDDAMCCMEIYKRLKTRLEEKNIVTLKEAQSFTHPQYEEIKHMPSYHVILLVKNETGRVNLYNMVSRSSLDYFGGNPGRPRIPKSLLEKHREGIIVGSACSLGELFNAVLEGQTHEEIARIGAFYDYFEVQPLGNNQYLIDDDFYDEIHTKEDLQNLNKEIIKLADYFQKPVVATGDVHFLNPEDALYRAILQAGSGYKESEDQPPLYLRTTEEMLAEFSYLGAEKAYEIVVENTNAIADQIESISPVRPDTCPPVIKNSDVDLKNACYKQAHEWYGENLPEIVEKRLDRELTAITSKGYDVMYMIAQKLVNKSVSDGYLVGSRGSVGSSIVATMSGITEVNPLRPHYRCPACKYSDFESDDVKPFLKGAGADMPDKLCPKCGTKMIKDGFNIPFETFLGFYGDKEPDIDLNFSGEYQSKAHAYTEVIFGKGQTFRAGTQGTVAEKTAIGYTLHYFEERNIEKRHCEIARIGKGVEGVLRTTGQHPGGIVVLPLGEDINTFTPIQHPANDQTSPIITTHFEYHSIDHNLLKLDILGHDDPTMIRMLQDLTKIDPRTFPLDSPEVMSLFQNTSALGITSEDIRGVKLGALGIPEFGTDFAMNMVIECQPTKFSDLIRITGMAHGTDVWSNNNQVLFQEGTANLSTAICCRDDIMEFLIDKGLESSLSFTIMEKVRKGKGLTKEWEEEMRKHDVPEWYIWSCNKIKYMFPKAHAAAYVMMAWRIAYCKVFFPLEYYCAYFTVRGDGFNYEKMCQGKEYLERQMDAYENATEKHSDKEDVEYRDMRITQEMYARGFGFVPIDIMVADSTHFKIVDDKHLMAAFTSIEGLGENAADSVVEARKKGEFSSMSDIKSRTKLSQTIIEKMVELHIIKDLPEDDQLSLFDHFGA